MSSKKEVKITCPRCDATSPFTVWLSINTADDPELKESVRINPCSGSPVLIAVWKR